MDVTEDLLQVTAKQIVNSFSEGETSLTNGVRKKASEMGLNRDQTARLIERTNAEAFLSIFPERTDFNVADPDVILSEKTASEKATNKSYKDLVSRDFNEIFGLQTEKTASVNTMSKEDIAKAVVNDLVFENFLAEQSRLAKFATESAVDQAEKVAWNSFKEAVLFGSSVGELEKDLILYYPEKKAFLEDVITEFTSRLAKDTAVDTRLFKRASEIDVNEVIGETPIANAFRGLVDLV